MAITAVNLLQETGSSITSHTTASITPQANKLYLLAVVGKATTPGPIPTVTGCGMTWVQARTVDTNNRRITLFRAMKASGITPGALTISFGATSVDNASFHLSEWSGVDTTGTDGAGALVQVGGDSGSSQTTGTVNLSTFGSANNAAYGAISHNQAEGANPESGYTELGDTNFGDTALISLWKVGQDLTVTATWATSANWRGVSAEIKASLSVTYQKTGAGVLSGGASAGRERGAERTGAVARDHAAAGVDEATVNKRGASARSQGATGESAKLANRSGRSVRDNAAAGARIKTAITQKTGKSVRGNSASGISMSTQVHRGFSVKRENASSGKSTSTFNRKGASVRSNSGKGHRTIARPPVPVQPGISTLAGFYFGSSYLNWFTRKPALTRILRPDTISSGEEVGVAAFTPLLAPAFVLQPDHKITSPLLIEYRGLRLISNVRVRLDGKGGRTSGRALVRAVVYTEMGKLVGESNEIVLPAGAEEKWYSFALRAPVILPGTYEVGVHGGGDRDIARVLTSVGGRARYNIDTYVDGADDPYGVASHAANRIRVVMLSFPAYSAPLETDSYYGRLPVAESEVALTTGVDSTVAGRCGWHGEVIDRELGAFAVVKTGGPLEKLLGHRVKVRRRGGEDHIVAYVHLHGQVVDDLSLTRRMFSRIANLTDDPIPVEVEVLK